MREGIALEGIEPWRFFPLISKELAEQIWESSREFLEDGRTWLSFFNDLNVSQLLMIPGEGFIRVNEIRPGLTANIHGGRLHGARTLAPEDLPPLFRSALDWIMEKGNFGALVSYPPEHNIPAKDLLEAAGFNLTGIIPLSGFWRGRARSIHVYALHRQGD